MEDKFLIEETSMSELLKDVPEKVRSGTVVSARVLGSNADGVLVDIGLKMEGLIPKSEFPDFEKSLPFKEGETISVLVQRVEGQENYTRVSWRAAREWSAWDKLYTAFRSEAPVEGVVRRKVKGGYVVDVGMDAFLPGSQLDVRPTREVDAWLNEPVRVLITEMDRAKSNVVVSRRKLLERERIKQREATLSALAEGDVRTGKVSSITKFGAFVDIGGIEGLLHISDVSWLRTDRLEDVLKVGQSLSVKVLKYDVATQRISLGLKQLTPRPWEGVERRFPVGSVVKGRVTSITNFGAFVELEPGVEGLLHVSELSWSDKSAKVQDYLARGQEVTVKVLLVDPKKEKLSLSLKRAGESPYEALKARRPIGSRLKGVITHLTPFGAFVRLSEGLEGLVHVSDFSWTQRIKHPAEMVHVDQEVEVVLMDVKPDAEKIVLSLKHLQEDPLASLRVGQVVNGNVVSIQEGDVIVELPSGLQSTIHRNELSQAANGQEQVPEVGQLVTAKVVRVDPRERRVELSIRRYEKDQERQMVARYAGQNQEPLTLGDILVENESSDSSDA
jgi:small subunit ribosomal protein S1